MNWQQPTTGFPSINQHVIGYYPRTNNSVEEFIEVWRDEDGDWLHGPNYYSEISQSIAEPLLVCEIERHPKMDFVLCDPIYPLHIVRII